MYLKKRFSVKSKGLTLIEVFVTITIIVMAVFGMAITLSMLMRASQKTVDHSAGYMAANSILRQFIADNRRHMEEAEHEGDITFGYKKYHYKMTVRKASNLSLYQITVMVEWSQADESGSHKSLKAEVATMAKAEPATAANRPKYPEDASGGH